MDFRVQCSVLSSSWPGLTRPSTPYRVSNKHTTVGTSRLHSRLRQLDLRLTESISSSLLKIHLTPHTSHLTPHHARIKHTRTSALAGNPASVPQAYGVNMHAEIAKQTGKDYPLGSIYAALERLEAKGLVAKNQGEATRERGGRKKLYFEITGLGRCSLDSSLRAIDRMKAGLQLAGATQ